MERLCWLECARCTVVANSVNASTVQRGFCVYTRLPRGVAEVGVPGVELALPPLVFSCLKKLVM